MDLINSLKEKMKQRLPGQTAQMEMSHVLRRSFKPAPDNAQLAAVLLLLFPNDGEWHIALTQRASKYAHDKHKGQMSFPGGSKEDEDFDLEMTAKRETYEEIGVNRNEIEVIGGLTNLYIPVSNFLVHPFVGYVKETPKFVLEENEVEELVSSSVEVICSNEIRKKKNLKISKQMSLNQVPYFDVQGKVVWGATAMILNEFVTIHKQKIGA